MSPYSFPVVVLRDIDRNQNAGSVVLEKVPVSKWLFVTRVTKKSFAANEVYTAELYLEFSN